MQIQMHNSLLSNILSSLPQPNVGDILQLTIKDRMMNQNAMVSMRGTTSMVTFEGSVPKEDKVFVEITGKSAEGNFTVKVSDRSVTSSTSQTDALVNSAVKLFSLKGMTVTKENAASIKEFLTNGKGTVEQKVDTLRNMAQKQIPISDASLESVHESLNGKPLSSSLESLVNGLKSESVPVYTEVQRETNVAKMIHIMEDYLINTELNDSIKSLLENSIAESKKLTQAGQYADAKAILLKGLDILKNLQTSFVHSSQSLGVEGKEGKKSDFQIQRGLSDDQKIQTHQGNQLFEVPEAASRQEQSNESTDVMGRQNSIIEPALSITEYYTINEAIQPLKLDSQNVLVTEITKKLSQLTIDFKTLKQDIAKNLDNVSKILENQNILPQTNVKQIIESTIHKLDNAILKGEFLLYTDMATEKKLLLASSQLADAKKLLARGDTPEASKLVQEVKGAIENLIFKPSDVNVKHFIMDKQNFGGLSSTGQMAKVMEQVVQPFSDGESSSRQMYETFRRLGLTVEREAALSFASSSGGSQSSFNQQQSENVKTILLKMMQNDELKPQQKQQAEQVVNSISGQQLLNKQDSSGQQNLFFQLPHMFENQVENIKIYVNSRKDGDKLDWENCSIYFVLETKKLGDIGVLLSSTAKNVNLTFRSNKDNLEEKLANFTEITQDRFKEIGYNLNTMNVKALEEQKEMNREEEKIVSQDEMTPPANNKGYDISI